MDGFAVAEGEGVADVAVDPVGGVFQFHVYVDQDDDAVAGDDESCRFAAYLGLRAAPLGVVFSEMLSKTGHFELRWVRRRIGSKLMVRGRRRLDFLLPMPITSAHAESNLITTESDLGGRGQGLSRDLAVLEPVEVSRGIAALPVAGGE